MADAAPVKVTKLKQTPVSKLTPYPQNTRLHDDVQVRQIADSIKRFGFNNPILIDGDGNIIAGHGRYEAAVLLGMKSVPTVDLSHLSPEERAAYGIADNRIALGSMWDYDTLAEELKALEQVEFDLDVLGFAEQELDGILQRSYAPPGTTGDNAGEHWTGMPEFNQPDKTAHQSIHVHFKDQAAVDAFAALVKQNVTPKTRSMWFPEWEIDKALDKRYGNDGEDADGDSGAA